MKAALPEPRLAETWARLTTQSGAFTRIVSITKDPSGPFVVVATTCEFERGPVTVVTTFNAAGEIAGLGFRDAYAPPPYANAKAFADTEVTVGAGTEWALPGTLSMPIGDGPFPAVVLVHGSGPNDRDETLGPNKPFADLAAGLASRGIAVLRYEKRTKQYPEKAARATAFTVKDETIDDALAAVTLAASTPRIDPARVFVLGHSLGGTVAPRIAAANPKIRGLIIMAGLVRPLAETLVDQLDYIARADGQVTPDEQKQIDAVRAAVEVVHTLTPADAARGAVVLNAPASYWLDLAGYDPATAAASLPQPMLILQGERDYQVTMVDFARWKAALGGRKTVTLRSYPTLNHLFAAGTGPSAPAEYARASHVAVDVVQDIRDWVAAQ
jgi:dienelactone hydrolase